MRDWVLRAKQSLARVQPEYELSDKSLKLPIHPTPYSDECFESYVMRLTLSNRLPQSLARPMFRVIMAEENYTYLSKITGLDESKFTKMAITQSLAYDGPEWFELSGLYYHQLWRTIIDPLRIGEAPFTFCPTCLNENFYYKCAWKYRLSFLCPRHKTLLVNWCGCEKGYEGSCPWRPRLSDRCSYCGLNPSKVKPELVSDPIAMKAQIAILKMLVRGTYFKTESGTMLSREHFFFAIRLFYTLLNKIETQSDQGKEALRTLRRLKRQEASMGLPRDIERRTRENFYFQVRHFRARVNCLLLTSAFRTLLDWPHNFFGLLDRLSRMVGRELGYPCHSVGVGIIDHPEKTVNRKLLGVILNELIIDN